MNRDETQCRRSCQDCRPYEPETWCSGCVAEATDREENMIRRWRAVEAKASRWREAVRLWTARCAGKAPHCPDCGLYYMPGDHHECPEIGAHSVINPMFHSDEIRRNNLARWEARFQNTPEECP